MHSFQFTVRAENSAMVVDVAGELDLATAPLLEDALMSAPPGLDIIVDLEHVSFMDARGVTALITAERHIRSHGASLRVRNAAPHVERVIEITGQGPWLR